jgi:DNA repair protein RecO
MLPLYHVQVELREGSAGFATMRAVCIDTHKECRDDPFAYACAHRAIDLLSKSLEDDVPVPDVFLLFSDFLNALTGSHDPILLDLFIVRFLHLFGALPSLQESVASHRMFAPNDTIVFSTRHHGFCRLDEDSHGYALSPQTHAFLREVFLGSLVKIVQHVPASVRQELGSIVAFISGANGLAPLPVRRANSSAVTPI